MVNFQAVFFCCQSYRALTYQTIQNWLACYQSSLSIVLFPRVCCPIQDFAGNCQSMGNLQFLNQFYICSCKFTGTSPNSLGSFSQLQFLSFSSNKLSGSIPSSIANLTQLQLLALDSNYLTGPIPSLVRWKPATDESKQHSRFSYESELLSLLSLELSNNLFDGVTDCSLFELPSLTSLLLAKNVFHSSPNWFLQVFLISDLSRS